MKKITLVLFVLVAFCWQSNAQVQVGDGTYSSAFNTYPINPYYGYSYAQSIYLASEINSSGDITSISFEMGDADAIANSDDEIDLWIGQTTKTEFDSTADWVDISTLTQVMTNGTLTKTGTTITFTFSAPFTYNGTDNLIIALDANEDAYDTSADFLIGTDVGSNRTLRFQVDAMANNPDPTAPPTGVLTPYVGNITFNGITSICLPAAATASIVEDCDNAQFSILVDVTDLGDSINLEITNDAGAASTTVTASGEVTVGPFPVGSPVVLTLVNENDNICDVALDSILDLCPTAVNTLDFYNLQFPATLTFPLNEMTDQFVYAQAYEAGLTDTTMGSAAEGIECWIGYSITDTDPSGTGWTWEVATFNVEVGNNDEYAVAMQDLGLAEGTYYYASRFTLNAGPFMYGGILADGSNGNAWDGTTNISGVLTVEARVPLAGDDCSNPIIVNTLPYNTADDTVNYTNGFGNGDSPCSNFYMSGNDVVYTYTPSADASINFELSGLSGTYSGIHVLDGCPTDAMTTCLGFAGDGSSADRAVENISVVNGATYYIIISTWAAPNSVAYTLDITENTCTNATVGYAVVSDCDNSGGFIIEIDVTDMGTATDITVTDDQGSTAQTTMAIAMLTFGPYDNGTNVVVTISDDNDASCVQTSGNLTQTVCPPANDACINAIVVNDGDSVTGTTLGATNVEDLTECAGGVGSELLECPGGTGGINFGAGVWYVYTAQPGEIITVTTDNSLTPFDTEIQVFSGDCGNLVCVGGDDDGGDNAALSTICWESTSTTDRANVDYFIYVDGHLTNSGDFTLDINAESILSTIDVENEAAFTYYPNPVKNTLTLNAQNTIENVIVFNMLGQVVLKAIPNTITSDLDTSSLQTGTYFVQVTIANVTKTVRVIKQ